MSGKERDKMVSRVRVMAIYGCIKYYYTCPNHHS
jgi:hypothetical protein